MKISAVIIWPLYILLVIGCSRAGEPARVEKIYIMEKDGKAVPMTENKEIIRILDLPKTRQAENWTCGANVVQKVCQYYGEDYREMDLVKALGADAENGTALQPIIDFLKARNFRIDIRERMTVPELKGFIDRDIPVILMLQAWVKDTAELSGWDNGHFSVCIGYTRDELLFADPSLYDIGFIPADRLEARWHDLDVGGRRYYQLGIAVYGKKPKFDLEKIEEIK